MVVPAMGVPHHFRRLIPRCAAHYVPVQWHKSTRARVYVYPSVHRLNCYRCFQTPAVSPSGPHIREVRAGHVYAQGTGGRGGRRLLLRILQRGHRGLLETGKRPRSLLTAKICNCNFPARHGILECSAYVLCYDGSFRNSHVLDLWDVQFTISLWAPESWEFYF